MGTEPHFDELDDEGDLDLPVYRAAAFLLAYLPTILLPALVFGLGLGLAALFSGAKATSSFVPNAPSSGPSSTFAGLAAQIGLAIPGLEGGESVVFYDRLLKSRTILGDLAQDTFTFAIGEERQDTLSGDMIALLEISEDTREKEINDAISELEERVTVTTDLEAGIVRLVTRSPWPELSVAMNARLLDLVNEFNLETRQSRARAERVFAESRLAAAREELASAEARLEAFLERNRTYESSPQLAFEASRLERQIAINQQIYMTLAQAYESARIEEVRNTPVITVLDRPEGSARRLRNPVAFSIFGLGAGALFGILLAALRLFLSRQRATYPDDYRKFRLLVRERMGLIQRAGSRK